MGQEGWFGLVWKALNSTQCIAMNEWMLELLGQQKQDRTGVLLQDRTWQNWYIFSSQAYNYGYKCVNWNTSKTWRRCTINTVYSCSFEPVLVSHPNYCCANYSLWTPGSTGTRTTGFGRSREQSRRSRRRAVLLTRVSPSLNTSNNPAHQDQQSDVFGHLNFNFCHFGLFGF